ncbi:DUF2971 domain-containing protein [Sporosarcina sp. 179-K 8C2 HS]|uniref:DUF2971 domain-containing protein n=1 Tax=Sporosarcina sp. 179-K 8C2 HS TaxID=3142387 RepID=UPI0039A048DB
MYDTTSKDKFFEILFSQEEKENHLALLTLAKLDILPPKLYRYRPINEHLADTLNNDTAFLSPAYNFNDPYDSGLTVDYEIHLNRIREKVLLDFSTSFFHLYPNRNLEDFFGEIKNLFKDVPLKDLGRLLGNSLNQDELTIQDLNSKIKYMTEQTKETYEDYIKSLSELYQSTVYVACFTETHDNILMWSHYAQNHEGICIEYDFSSLDYTSRTIQSLSPVKYTNKLFDTNDYSNRTPIDEIQLAALSKFDSWEYENEWRLISFIKEEQRFQLIKPTAVIFGTKTLKENKEWISKICEERGIHTKQAELSRTEYKLHII